MISKTIHVEFTLIELQTIYEALDEKKAQIKNNADTFVREAGNDNAKVFALCRQVCRILDPLEKIISAHNKLINIEQDA